MLNEVVIQQAVFKLIHRATSLRRQFFETTQTRNAHPMWLRWMRALRHWQRSKPGDLFPFAVQLLDLPAEATHLLCRLRGILSLVVGHDVVRAVGRHLNPEALHFVVFGEAFDLDALAVGQLLGAPGQRIDALVEALAPRIIHLSIIFERAVVALLEGLDEQHQVFGRVPRVHQHGMKGQLFLIHHIGEHLADVVQLAFAVAVGVVDAIVNQPELVGLGLDIHTSHDPDAFDDGFGVAAILGAHQFDGKRGVFVEHGIVKHHKAREGGNDLRPHVLPDKRG